jgi:hypothetical protein
MFSVSRRRDKRFWTEWQQQFPKHMNLYHIFRRFIGNLCVVILSCILFVKHEHTLCLFFPAFAWWVTSLLATNKDSAFCSRVSWSTSWCIPFVLSPFWFTWTFFIAHSEVKLKGDVDAVPFFRSFWIGSASDRINVCPSGLYCRFYLNTF